MVPDLLVHFQEQAEQKVVVNLLHQLLIVADGVEGNQCLGLGELLFPRKSPNPCPAQSYLIVAALQQHNLIHLVPHTFDSSASAVVSDESVVK